MEEEWKKMKTVIFENALIYAMMKNEKFLNELGTALYYELREEK